MTPKEKAEELVDKYTPLVYCYMGSGMLSNHYDENVAKDNAKQCALIAVDLRLECDFIFVSIEYGEESLEYWQEVKNEINNL